MAALGFEESNLRKETSTSASPPIFSKYPSKGPLRPDTQLSMNALKMEIEGTP
jgi:hypothetical protein